MELTPQEVKIAKVAVAALIDVAVGDDEQIDYLFDCRGTQLVSNPDDDDEIDEVSGEVRALYEKLAIAASDD